MTRRAVLSRSLALIGSTALILTITASCGSGIAAGGPDGGDEGGFTPDGGEGGSTTRDGAAPPLADAPFACGNTTCRVDQYCLQPCCGGPAPACEPANDAGGCPAGFHPGSCPGLGTQGCVMDPCVPAPASCIDDPKTQGTGCDQRGSSRYLMCECA